MKNLGILLTNNYRLLSVAAMIDVFQSANSFCNKENKPEAFNIYLISNNPSTTSLNELPVYATDKVPKPDIILIPAFNTEQMEENIGKNLGYINWLKLQYNAGCEIASFCTGAFLLASTGLLTNIRATTHVQAAEKFKEAFPAVSLNSDKITTFEKGIYTSGGATNSFYLMFMIIEKYCGRNLLLKVSKYFAVDLNRTHQSYFSTFNPVTGHKDDLVTMVQEKMEKEYNERSTVEEFLVEIPASRRNLVRRFKGATGITPIEYLQRTRMEAAKKLLEDTNRTILDIMLQVGYNDLKTFRLLFKKITGLTPTEYREKFIPVRNKKLSSENEAIMA